MFKRIWKNLFESKRVYYRYTRYVNPYKCIHSIIRKGTKEILYQETTYQATLHDRDLAFSYYGLTQRALADGYIICANIEGEQND